MLANPNKRKGFAYTFENMIRSVITEHARELLEATEAREIVTYANTVAARRIDLLVSSESSGGVCINVFSLRFWLRLIACPFPPYL